jgi:hypothetical protein
MTSLPSHHPATRPPAAGGPTCTGMMVAEREAGAASVGTAAPDANVAIVVSKLIAMGVNVSLLLPGSASESPVRNDGAQPSEPQAFRRRQYEAHICSTAWKNSAARLAELAAAGFRCRICNRGREEVRLEVHHRTYRNFGCELVGDLTTLCGDCHVVNTDMLRRRRYTFHLPVFADVPAPERGAPLFDPMAPGESS